MPADCKLSISVRSAQASDVPKLARALAPDVGAEQVANRFQEATDGYREMFVADLNDEAVGTVSTTEYSFRIPGSLRMFALDVGPSFRDRGVGTALIRAIEKMALERGMKKRVSLEVALDNGGAIRLYERLGYYRLDAPFTNQWTKVTDGGVQEVVEERSWVMVKDL